MLAALLLLVAAPASSEAPPPPPVLAPYFHDGVFDPGDYGWMRGAFADSAPDQKAAYESIQAWLRDCREAGVATQREALAAIDIANPKLEYLPSADPLCAQVSVPGPLEAENFAAFTRAAERATPIVQAYLYAVGIAEEVSHGVARDQAGAIATRPTREQMLRFAMGWGEGDHKDAPPLEGDARVILLSRIYGVAGAADIANTRWLKQLVEESGWPSIPKVGEVASSAAWLMVQHADHDPAFQLKALRLMAPLAEKGEVSKSNYAYLYDRVMLKLAGTQRYATQVTCVGGKRVPQPLEPGVDVESVRSEAGLEPLSDYIGFMDAHFSPCPKGD